MDTNEDISELHFEVLPLEVAQKLPELDLSSFSLKVVSTTQTKANDGGGILPVKSITCLNEEVIIETSGENLPALFFKGVEGASCRLKLTDGINNVSSSYFSLTPDNTDGGFFFRLQDLNGEQFEPFLVDKDVIHIVVPQNINLSALYPIFTGNDVFMSSFGFEITGKQAFDFSDFTKPFTFRQVSASGTEKNWTVNLYDLPVLVMNTPDGKPILSKTERVEGCTMKIYNTNQEVSDLGTAGVRGRGNTTWKYPKKPYNVKLDKKKEVLGMNKSKHWQLISNPFYDRTQIHNATAYEVARLTDYPWVQNGKFVELILNGEHRGIYYVCEKVRVESGKIDIAETKANTPADESGYLLESRVDLADGFNIDTYPENCFSTGVLTETGHGATICVLGWEISEPEDYLRNDHIEYVKNSLAYVETLIANSVETGEYRDYFDIETAIDWWLTEQLCLNEEATRSKNIYMYKDGKGLFRLGPPWDFDYSTFGQLGTGALSWNINSALYYRYLFNDPVFVRRLKEKWNEYKEKWRMQIPVFIEENGKMLKRAGERNSAMWPDWYWANFYPQYSYMELIHTMKDNFIKQLEYMDGWINSL